MAVRTVSDEDDTLLPAPIPEKIGINSAEILFFRPHPDPLQRRGRKKKKIVAESGRTVDRILYCVRAK
jgi:hypothetical protein